MPHAYAPSRRRTALPACTNVRNSSRVAGSIRYSTVTRTGPASESDSGTSITSPGAKIPGPDVSAQNSRTHLRFLVRQRQTRQRPFEDGAVRFELGRKLQLFAEVLGRFV